MRAIAVQRLYCTKPHDYQSAADSELTSYPHLRFSYCRGLLPYDTIRFVFAPKNGSYANRMERPPTFKINLYCSLFAAKTTSIEGGIGVVFCIRGGGSELGVLLGSLEVGFYLNARRDWGGGDRE